VLRSLSAAGTRASTAFSGGFGTGLARGLRSASRSLEAFRFPETAIRSQARDAAVSYQREFDRIMRNNRRLGTTSQLVDSGQVTRNNLTEQSLRRLNNEQQKFIDGAGR